MRRIRFPAPPHTRFPVLVLTLASALALVVVAERIAAQSGPEIEVYYLGQGRWSLLRTPGDPSLVTVRQRDQEWDISEGALNDEGWRQAWQRTLRSDETGQALWRTALARMLASPDTAPFRRGVPDLWLAVRRRSGNNVLVTVVNQKAAENHVLLLSGGVWRPKEKLSHAELLHLPAGPGSLLERFMGGAHAPGKGSFLNGWMANVLGKGGSELILYQAGDGTWLRVLQEPLAEDQFAARLRKGASAPPPLPVGATTPPPPETAGRAEPPSSALAATPPGAEAANELADYRVALGIVAGLLLLALLVTRLRHGLWSLLKNLGLLLPWRQRAAEQEADAATETSLEDLILALHDMATETLRLQPDQEPELHRGALTYSKDAYLKAAQAFRRRPGSKTLATGVQHELAGWLMADLGLAEGESLEELVQLGRKVSQAWQQAAPSERRFPTAQAFLLATLQAEGQHRLDLSAKDQEIKRLQGDLTSETKNKNQLIREKDHEIEERNRLQQSLDELNRKTQKDRTELADLRANYRALESERDRLAEETAQQTIQIEKLGKTQAARREELRIKTDKLAAIEKVGALLRSVQVSYWDRTQHQASSAVFLYIRFLSLYQLIAAVARDDPMSERAGWINIRNLLLRISQSGVVTDRFEILERLCPGINGMVIHDEPAHDSESVLTSQVLDHLGSGGSRSGQGFDPARLKGAWPVYFRVENGRTWFAT